MLPLYASISYDKYLSPIHEHCVVFDAVKPMKNYKQQFQNNRFISTQYVNNPIHYVSMRRCVDSWFHNEGYQCVQHKKLSVFLMYDIEEQMPSPRI